MLTSPDGFELTFPDGHPWGGFVAGDGCDFDCCGVASGWYAAFPCAEDLGCGGLPEDNTPIFIPTDFVCAPGGDPPPTPGIVIGFQRSCWIVDPTIVYRACSPIAPPTLHCLPDNARVLAPGTPVVCLPNCEHEDCLDTRPRWIRLRPCDQSVWPPAGMPPGTPRPIVRAGPFPNGCFVGAGPDGNCWVADCANVFAAREEELGPDETVWEGIQFNSRSCCECGCGGGGAVSQGCDEQYPLVPEVRCCCPGGSGVPLNAGATLTYTRTKVIEGVVGPGYRTRETWFWSGTFVADGAGGQTGSGELVHTLEFLPPHCNTALPDCPPGVPCVETTVSPHSMDVACPPPLQFGRPCPPGPGEPPFEWDGRATCSGAWHRYRREALPGRSVCEGNVITTDEGMVTLTGVDTAPCQGGCGEAVNIPFGTNFVIPIGSYAESAESGQARNAEGGVVVKKWLGLEWYGTPMPLRLVGGLLGRGVYDPGCGCIKPLKDLWTRMRGGRP